MRISAATGDDDGEPVIGGVEFVVDGEDGDDGVDDDVGAVAAGA